MKSKPQSPLNDQYIILVESYLEKCKAEGNCEWTLTFKRKSCEEFLIEMINRGKDLSTLDAAAVGNISINKFFYEQGKFRRQQGKLGTRGVSFHISPSLR